MFVCAPGLLFQSGFSCVFACGVPYLCIMFRIFIKSFEFEHTMITNRMGTNLIRMQLSQQSVVDNCNRKLQNIAIITLESIFVPYRWSFTFHIV